MNIRRIMTDEEDKGVQKNTETPLHFKKISQSNYHESKCAVQDFHGIKYDTDFRPCNFIDFDHPFNWDAVRPIHQAHNRLFYEQKVLMWPVTYPDVRIPQQCFMNFGFPMNIERFNPRVNYPHEHLPQEFQYFVVIDFEATCDKIQNPHPQEIIEFPSVLVNSFTGIQEASFQTYVRPVYHQLLTDFCKELTGIQQVQVDSGVSLSEALLMHDKWLEDKGIKLKNFAVVTWSNWDCQVMLESECLFKGIQKPSYFNKWINLKVPFQEVFGGIRCNLKEAVQLAGLAWEGRAHCGLDDARNTARLLSHLMRRGFRLSITNSLAHHPPEQTPDCSADLKEKTGAELFKEKVIFCFCGVRSCRSMVQKPGPMQGRWFFGCGKSTAACNYFVWALQ